MSTIKIDNFVARTEQLNGNTSTVTARTIVNGPARVWCYYTASSGSTATVGASYNLTSITNNGTGDWTSTFTVAMASSSYAPSGWARISGNGGAFQGSNDSAPTASSFRWGTTSAGGTFTNPVYGSFIVHGNQ